MRRSGMMSLSDSFTEYMNANLVDVIADMQKFLYGLLNTFICVEVDCMILGF
jgi:hypothetical protein